MRLLFTRAQLGRAVRKDYFPYFTQGKAINVTSMEVYGDAVTKHHAAGNAAGATTDLGDPNKLEFVLTVPEDPAGPTRVMARARSAQAFLVIRYSL